MKYMITIGLPEPRFAIEEIMPELDKNNFLLDAQVHEHGTLFRKI